MEIYKNLKSKFNQLSFRARFILIGWILIITLFLLYSIFIVLMHPIFLNYVNNSSALLDKYNDKIVSTEVSYEGKNSQIVVKTVEYENLSTDEIIRTVNDTLRMYKNDDIRMYNFNCITDTIVEVITTCNTYTLLTVHLL